MVDSPDCALTHIGNGRRLGSSCDFFYPLVDDPYYQGKIGAANVLSDLFAAGIFNIQHVLMILGVCNQMTQEEQDISTKLMIKGFNDTVREAGSMVVGGQTVINKWPMIGGTAIGFQDEKLGGFYSPVNAKVGDKLVQTKPIGNQMIVNFNQYYKLNNERWQKLLATGKINAEHVEELYEQGLIYMSRLNRNGAILMLKYGGTSSTDVTGFGQIGHATNLAEVQKNKVDYAFHTIPCFKGLKDQDKIVRDFKQKEGLAAETSGGLLISLPQENVESYIKDMHDLGESAWVVGDVVEGKSDKGKSYMRDDCVFVDA